MQSIANANIKVVGGASIGSVVILCWWLFNNVVWAETYNRDKQTALENKLKHRRDEIDYKIEQLQLFRPEMVNPAVKNTLENKLKQKRNDISDHLDVIRGK